MIHDHDIPISIKELIAEYEKSPFFKDIYKYKTKNHIPLQIKETALRRLKTGCEDHLVIDVLFRIKIPKDKNIEPSIGVYRKPTHTDLYLPWDSNHNIAAKYSMINTLSHRTHTTCSTSELAEEELLHLKYVLRRCKYPKLAIRKIFRKHQHKEKNKAPKTKYPAKCHIVIPYTQGIGESLKNICKKHGLDVHFKGGQTLKNILVSSKDKDKITSKNSVIYSYTCGMIDCDEEYIGESGRTFGERYKENLKAPSPIFLHQSNSGYVTTLDNFKITGREGNSLARTIEESMYIRVNNPTLNRNIGKYNLPHIWDKLLFSIPELKKK